MNCSRWSSSTKPWAGAGSHEGMSRAPLWRVGRLFGHGPLQACRVEKSLRTVEGASNAKERRKPMTISPLAGKAAPKEMLVDPARLEQEFYARRPDVRDPNQLVSFG